MFDMDDFQIRIRKGGDDALNAVCEYVAELACEVHSIDVTHLGVLPQQWVPVSKRLPEEGERVLVFDKAFGREMGTYYANDGWVGDEIASLDPSHWMPLPEPPTDAK